MPWSARGRLFEPQLRNLYAIVLEVILPRPLHPNQVVIVCYAQRPYGRVGHRSHAHRLNFP
jgi:hypothetical protein